MGRRRPKFCPECTDLLLSDYFGQGQGLDKDDSFTAVRSRVGSTSEQVGLQKIANFRVLGGSLLDPEQGSG
jgi:hypothetical protein